MAGDRVRGARLRDAFFGGAHFTDEAKQVDKPVDPSFC
jgi:hypothetical protein